MDAGISDYAGNACTNLVLRPLTSIRHRVFKRTTVTQALVSDGLNTLIFVISFLIFISSHNDRLATKTLNICMTILLWGDSTGDRWPPSQKAQWSGKHIHIYDDIIMTCKYGYLTCNGTFCEKKMGKQRLNMLNHLDCKCTGHQI